MTVEVSESAEFCVPAAFAFAYLADPATARVIDPAIREYRPDAVPMGVGTRTAVRMRMWGVPVRAVSVVTEWEPGRRMVMASERPSRPVRVTATHRFEALDDDRCRYTWVVAVTPTAPLGSLAARAFARFMRANVAAQQARFGAAVRRQWAASRPRPA
jgi:hypothetical protein